MKREVLLGSAGTLAAGALAWLLWGNSEPGSSGRSSQSLRGVIECHPDEEG